MKRIMMKFAILILASLLVACSATDFDGTEDSEETERILAVSDNSDGSNWPEVMYFPDDEGNLQPGKLLGRDYYKPATKRDVLFFLYTRQNSKNEEILEIGDAEKLRNSTFNRLQPTIFLTHGYLTSKHYLSVKSLKNKYLEYHEVNVIAVDWSRISHNVNYYIVKKQTVPVGSVVAEFLQFLHESGGADLGNIHLIGHSLGAHVMGIAGKKIQNVRKVGRITGLDPAGPLFTLGQVDKRLDRGDADFVDIIHTCGNHLGFFPAIGHVDFYPNGGVMHQPGCTRNPIYKECCSHSRAFEFYAESVNSSNFSSLSCDSYEDYKNRTNCNLDLMAPMGMPATNRTVGTYYLDTASSTPYALGQ